MQYLYTRTAVLCVILCCTGNQCNSHNPSVMCSALLASVSNQAPPAMCMHDTEASNGNHINKSSAVAEMGDHLATIYMSAAVPPSMGEMDPHLTRHLDQGPPPYQVASSSIQLYCHNTPMLQIGDQNKTRLFNIETGSLMPRPRLMLQKQKTNM